MLNFYSNSECCEKLNSWPSFLLRSLPFAAAGFGAPSVMDGVGACWLVLAQVPQIQDGLGDRRVRHMQLHCSAGLAMAHLAVALQLAVRRQFEPSFWVKAVVWGAVVAIQQHNLSPGPAAVEREGPAPRPPAPAPMPEEVRAGLRERARNAAEQRRNSPPEQ